MRRLLAPIAVLAVLACAPAEPAYLGTWVPDQSQADVTNITLQYEMVDSITYQVTVDGQTYTMSLDGTETETPWGGTTAVTPIDSLSWASVFRVGGTVISTDTVWLAADGQTLTSRANRPGPDGTVDVTEMQFRRVSGGPGLSGTWQASSMTGAMMGNMSIAAAGDSALEIHFASMQATCTPPLSGGDAVANSPMFDGTWTCAVAERDDGGLTLTWKRSGDPRYVSDFTVSADGNTLTEVATSTDVDEPVTLVYMRSTDEH